MKIKYFKALERSKQFNKNQKIWVTFEQPNDGYMWIVHKWRGKGRYVKAFLRYDSSYVGEIKEIDVDDDFVKRLYNTSGIQLEELKNEQSNLNR